MVSNRVGVTALVALFVLSVSAKTVEEVVIEAGCSTSVINALSEQIVSEMLCLNNNSMKSIQGKNNINLGSNTFGWLQSSAADHLISAVTQKNQTLTVTSAYRSLPHQYLLYRWKNLGLCGISAVAAPGRSSHNAGTAIEVNDFNTWTDVMPTNNWKLYGIGNKGRFDYTGNVTTDIASLSTLAFQKLWNLNNPLDAIAEDGVYNTNTEKRLQKAPVSGFAQVSCNNKRLKQESTSETKSAHKRLEDELCTVVGPKNGTCTTPQSCIGRYYGGYCPGPNDIFCCVAGETLPAITYNTSTAAINLIKEFEGYEPNFYFDSMGIKTIGYGHACHLYDCDTLIGKSASGFRYQVYPPLSEAEASDLLRADLEKAGFEDCVRDRVTRTSLSSSQFSSLVSFVWSVGCSGFASSQLLQRVNANAPIEGSGGIREAFLMWNLIDGVSVPGLTRRRNAEANFYGSDTSLDNYGNPYTPTIPRIDDNNDGYAGRDCWVDGDKGVCIDTTSQVCNYGIIKPGLCAGPSSMKCCLSQACTYMMINDGTCKLTSECTTSTRNGVCPGAYDIGCCHNFAKKRSVNANYICPMGASYNETLRFCADSQYAWGPFPAAMVDQCKQLGAGSQCDAVVETTVYGVNISLPRWSLAIANEARGVEDCPNGTSLIWETEGVADVANELNATLARRNLGQCAEKIEDAMTNYTTLLIYGGVTTDMADICAANNGGLACYSTRWSMKYYASVTQPRLEVNVETTDSSIFVNNGMTDIGNPFVFEQQTLSKELTKAAPSPSPSQSPSSSPLSIASSSSTPSTPSVSSSASPGVSSSTGDSTGSESSSDGHTTRFTYLVIFLFVLSFLQ